MDLSELKKHVVRHHYANVLEAMYLDWFNNYLTISTFAEHNELTEPEAMALIQLGRTVSYRLSAEHQQLKTEDK